MPPFEFERHLLTPTAPNTTPIVVAAPEQTVGNARVLTPQEMSHFVHQPFDLLMLHMEMFFEALRRGAAIMSGVSNVMRLQGEDVCSNAHDWDAWFRRAAQKRTLPIKCKAHITHPSSASAASERYRWEIARLPHGSTVVARAWVLLVRAHCSTVPRHISGRFPLP
eukprot:GEMP01057870.1.p1 GENE.GEMP01057870.1~~GEMP01057870.1.p1  ORF type:complete len:166 (+),score=26.86 GEMP01057870.1:108-605(+)